MMIRWRFGIGQLMGLVVAVALALAFIRRFGIVGGAWVVAVVVVAVTLRLRDWGAPAELLVLKATTAYFVVSAATIPFINSFWVGELPVLVLVQLPKLGLAVRTRDWLVNDVLGRLGWSTGSASPDLIMTRPYALALTYLILLGCLLMVVGLRTRFAPPYRRWVLICLGAAVVDFVCVLWFAAGSGLTIY